MNMKFLLLFYYYIVNIYNNHMRLILLFYFFSFLCTAQNVGDFYQGGVVFYTESSGNGLIIDTAYLNASEWGPHWVNASGAIEEFIGAGQFNTNNIASTTYPAANMCYNHESGGYSDWFLPSKDELWQIMLNINLIDSCMNIYVGEPINTGELHWSSTQAPNDSKAWASYTNATNMDTGESTGPGFYAWTKNNSALVRPIRCIDNDCSFVGSPIFGCMDPVAENYDPNAGANDFSCEYIVGCTYPNSCNYDPLATLNNFLLCDFSCIGCTDALALNYLGPEITVEDGSCLYCADEYKTIYVTYDSVLDNSMFFLIYNSLGNIVPFQEVSDELYATGFCIPDGCYTLEMFANCDITGDWVGNTLTIGDISIALDNVSLSQNIYIGDGSCDIGCMDSDYIEYEPLAIIDDGSCINLVTLGCNDQYSDNYNPTANTNDGSCEYSCPLNTEGLDVIYGDCYYYVSTGEYTIEEVMQLGYDCTCVEEGCLDLSACNYNDLANINDNSCTYPVLEINDCEGNCINDLDNDLICDEIDNCPELYNPSQEDLNIDDIGDACDGLYFDENIIQRKILKVTDVFGRVIDSNSANGYLIYIYNDGHIEKKYHIY